MDRYGHAIHVLQTDLQAMKIFKTLKIPLTPHCLPGYLLAFVLVIACAVLALAVDLRLAVPLLVAVTAVMSSALACVLYFGEDGRVSGSSGPGLR